MRAATALLLVACASGEDKPVSRGPSSDSAPPATFRVVLVADTHVIGPEYVCCSESPGLDNESIMKTPGRLEATVRQINEMDPQPDLVFVLGDVVHDTLVLDEPSAYSREETGFSRARDLFAELRAPVHFVWGNHDYAVHCDPRDDDRSREFTHEVFRDLLGGEPYGAIDHKGWRFLLTNSQLGPTWEPGHPLCDTGLASYGREQLAWVAEQLSAGLPTLAMAHYMMLVTQNNEDPDGPWPGMRAVLEAHPNLRLFAVGHTHRWIDLRETETFPHMVLGATRYDDDNFATLDLVEGGPDYEIIDYEKQDWSSMCADTWLYASGGAAPDPARPDEQGDCVN